MKRVVLCLAAYAALARPAELPVTQVTLYKHGVGFFERAGTLGPGESARLDFTSAEMNDVLKSLTIEERSGGKITGLRYDSMDPLSHTLAEFPFQIGSAQPLSGMLDQLKGARLELKFGNDTVTGIVVNGRLISGGDKQAEREQLTLMLDSGELRNVDLSAASGIRFSDAKLQQQFREYLTAVAAARSKEKRSVYIDSTDSKERQVTASYMVPAAVWKSSYRLIFGAKGEPILEGWAIVDNTTSEDWNKVALSLVSGRPISFVSQLYAPKYVTRPERSWRMIRRRCRWCIRGRLIGRKHWAGADREAAEGGARLQEGAFRPLRIAWSRWEACLAPWLPLSQRLRRRSRPAPSSPALPLGNWANFSNTASPSPSPFARTNPRCCPFCNKPSRRANC
jgi:hypothetical protein